MKTKKNKAVIDVRDVAALRKAVRGLSDVPAKKLNDAICDLIDAGGYSVAVLLDELPGFSAECQYQIVRKIEDFFYFHPENGVKLFKRLRKALSLVDHTCRANLLAAMADISEQAEESDFAIGGMGEHALAVLESDADPGRLAKAIEVLVKASEYSSIPVIIKLMTRLTAGLDNFQNYQFVETSLLALKRLGGESIIRLLINPSSEAATRQLRLQWRQMSESLLNATFSILQTLDTDFAQIMLKIVDLSDFNLPFIAMINEGVQHSDKWVRQTAVAAMQRASDALNPEEIARLLNDSASEVRLMAATSLGGFPASQTGSVLEELASRQGESREIRLNALYALFAQKNLTALKSLAVQPDSLQIAINSQGLAALLMPHEEGLKTMLTAYSLAKAELVADAGHYLLELTEPEDIEYLIKAHASGNETQRERLIDFIRQFIVKKSGPRLEVALKKLAPAEQKALKLLMPA
ncbi:MAG TPA: HEAT repeat domain-containing protein [Candidatus Rifleibacterium sp.]|nr:HEAT repeat domain-containing protein [Candidatus Rifleibacterium sp.]HPT44966.1 HEAT repeat domain-containing protein [Candidatus Rifleibacterium sp.]